MKAIILVYDDFGQLVAEQESVHCSKCGSIVMSADSLHRYVFNAIMSDHDERVTVSTEPTFIRPTVTYGYCCSSCLNKMKSKQ